MNVVGAQAQGWWRDREGALREFVAALQGLAGDRDVTAVIDGQPLAGLPEGRHDGVRVLYGPSADDRIVEEVRADADPESLTVVTADRELRERVVVMGADVSGPRALLDELAG